MRGKDKEIWFPAKKYGWGWGFPVTWQGWVVFINYLVCLFLGLVSFNLRVHMIAFLLFICLITAFFIAICWLKGEKPRWRWGGE